MTHFMIRSEPLLCPVLTETVAAFFVEVIEALGAVLAAGAVGQVGHVALAAAGQHALGGDTGADGLVTGQAGGGPP